MCHLLLHNILVCNASNIAFIQTYTQVLAPIWKDWELLQLSYLDRHVNTN